jgi:membrane protease YdiL (CAAX protease family)
MASNVGISVSREEQFLWLEDPGTDFPFYRGEPAAISSRQWLFVMAMVVAGFLALALPIPWPSGVFWSFVPALLMLGLPLMALAGVAAGNWKAIFGRVRGREVRLMFGFALLNILVSMSVGAVVMALFGTTSNGAAAQLGGLDMAGRITFFAKTIPQLLGEEIITVLPFLALLQWLTKGVGMGRKGAIVGAWLVTSVVFGLIHLPTYNWNWIQCIVVIGSARMVLTLPWLLTKNIWVSTGAHIVNDWLLFISMLIGAGMAGNG